MPCLFLQGLGLNCRQCASLRPSMGVSDFPLKGPSGTSRESLQVGTALWSDSPRWDVLSCPPGQDSLLSSWKTQSWFTYGIISHTLCAPLECLTPACTLNLDRGEKKTGPFIILFFGAQWEHVSVGGSETINLIPLMIMKLYISAVKA